MQAIERSPLRAAIYARISKDTQGDELGVRRQVRDCTDLAARRGFAVAGVYIDNDASAYGGRRRPEYERMLAAVRGGSVDVVLAWHPDRLYRHPRDLETFVEAVEGAGASVATVTAGELDLGTASGRMVARMLGATARFESEQKAERNRRKHRELAEAGKPTGGGDRPFGFEDDRVTHRAVEARLIRKAVAYLLQGGSLRSLAAQWEADGVRTPRGNVWRKTSIRRMVVSPRIAGLRSHQGATYEAVWKPIITRDEHEQLKALFATHAAAGRAPARSYLLTGGLARCARCGAAMVAQPNSRGARRYGCTRDAGGCNKTFQVAEPLEEFVTAAVFEALDTPALKALREVQPDDDEAEASAEVEALEVRRAELAEAYGSGALSIGAFQAADRDLQGRIDTARAQMRHTVERQAVVRLPSNAKALSAWWEQASIDDRRLLLDVVLEAVTVGPAVQGRNFFDEGRVTLRWRA